MSLQKKKCATNQQRVHFKWENIRKHFRYITCSDPTTISFLADFRNSFILNSLHKGRKYSKVHFRCEMFWQNRWNLSFILMHFCMQACQLHFQEAWLVVCRGFFQLFLDPKEGVGKLFVGWKPSLLMICKYQCCLKEVVRFMAISSIVFFQGEACYPCKHSIKIILSRTPKKPLSTRPK